MLKLYYHPLNASMAVRFILEKTKAQHELIFVDRNSDQHKSIEYLELNPTGRIPTLVDEGFVLFESAAICVYLASRYPEHELVPTKDPVQRAKFDQWLMYLTNTLQAELMIYHYPSRYADSNETQEFVKARAEERIGSMLKVLDEELIGNDFLLSSKVGVCDYFLFMLCVWADDLVQPPLSYEHLGRHLRKLAGLNEVIDVCKHEGLPLNSYQI